MKNIDKILVNIDFFDSNSSAFLEGSKSNQFYGKNVFFTQKLKGYKYNQFQVIGNLGGIPNDSEYDTSTEFYVVSDTLYEELKTGNKDTQLVELEERLNLKGKKYNNMNICTEQVFLKYIYNRCSKINDQVTLNLIQDLI